MRKPPLVYYTVQRNYLHCFSASTSKEGTLASPQSVISETLYAMRQWDNFRLLRKVRRKRWQGRTIQFQLDLNSAFCVLTTIHLHVVPDAGRMRMLVLNERAAVQLHAMRQSIFRRNLLQILHGMIDDINGQAFLRQQREVLP